MDAPLEVEADAGQDGGGGEVRSRAASHDSFDLA
jgi:hypothetical protein